MAGQIVTSDLELAAHHEAGHVLAAVVTGCEIGFVTVGPRGEGWTRFRAPPSVPPEQARLDAIQRHLAGAAGEGLFLRFAGLLAGLPFRELVRCWGGATDFRAARCASGDDNLESAWRRVVELLEARWPSVEALARALLADGAIEGRRAVAILNGESR